MATCPPRQGTGGHLLPDPAAAAAAATAAITKHGAKSAAAAAAALTAHSAKTAASVAAALSKVPAKAAVPATTAAAAAAMSEEEACRLPPPRLESTSEDAPDPPIAARAKAGERVRMEPFEGLEYQLFLPAAWRADGQESYPVVVFLHGAGDGKFSVMNSQSLPRLLAPDQSTVFDPRQIVL